ncbi:glycosyltransferase [Photobacterium aquimaris]|uniref:glycosyltransferase n=1 Tax=Photobacterium aquimaris TaxID=512643 RepID=UPI000AD8C9D9
MKSQIKPMRIWLVIDSKDVGGIESHILQLAKGLRRMQQEVTIIFLCRYHKQHPLISLCDQNYINYQFLSGSIGSLLQHTLKNNPAVIHSHGYKAAIYCRLIRLCLLLSSVKIRFINTFHAGEIPTGKVRLYDAIDRWSACLNHVNLVVSDAIKHRIPFKTELINNFIDTDALTLSHGKQIAFVGRLSNEKAPDRFVELARRLPQFSFHIYGDGPLARYCVNKHQQTYDFMVNNNQWILYGNILVYWLFVLVMKAYPWLLLRLWDVVFHLFLLLLVISTS